MITLSLSPVFGLGILGVLLLVLIVGLILVRGQAPRLPLADYTDPDARFNDLLLKVRKPWQYRAKVIRRRISGE